MFPYKFSFIIEEIVYSDKFKTKLQAIIWRKNTKQKLPGIVFIHGHNSNSWQLLSRAKFLTDLNYVVFLPTQRGYFPSRGRPDFCGPKTIEGIIEGINIFLKNKFIKKDKLIIWGISRGANIDSSNSD